jgi:hypothetical protein
LYAVVDFIFLDGISYGASSVYNISVVEKTFLEVGFSSISNI